MVANFVEHHTGQTRKSAKEVLAKAKELKSCDFSKNSLKEEANEKAFHFFEKSVKTPLNNESEATLRDDGRKWKSQSSYRTPTKRVFFYPIFCVFWIVETSSGDKKGASKSGLNKEAGNGDVILNGGAATNNGTWTSEEQKLLEQALKTFPSTVGDRWDQIAQCIPGRTKKECMARFKVGYTFYWGY